MKIITTDSNVEQRLQQVEKLLQELRLAIEIVPGGLAIYDRVNGAEYPIIDINNRGGVPELPRNFDSYRLQAEA